MFLFVCLLSGLADASDGEDPVFFRTLQIQRVTFPSKESFLAMGSSMCTNFSFWKPSLSRRDVDFQRRDVDFKCLCHISTWISTSQRRFLYSLERRDVNFYDSL